MKLLRSLLFWGHLCAGVTAGVIILILSATGVILALKPQILNWIERDVRFVQPMDTPRLAASKLIDAARADRPGALPVSLALDRNPSTAAAVNLGPSEMVYVNPYTGAVLGKGSARAQWFFRVVTDWHRWLAMNGEGRPTGRSIVGAANLAFLVLAASGLYLWWPRTWSPQHTRPILSFRRARTGRARDFNWHNVIGFWCAPAIIVMTASGAVISYPWATNLLYRMMGSVPPATGRGGGGGGGGGAADAQVPLSAVQIDGLWVRAEQQVPTWRTMSVRLPNGTGGPATFTINDAQTWNRFARSTLTLDSATGAVRQWQPYEAGSLGQKARGWLRFAHTGELGGLIGQIVAGVGCLGGMLLVWTGLALAWRRFLNWAVWARLRRRGSVIEPSDALPASPVRTAILE